MAVGTGENKEVISVDFEQSKIKGTPESVAVNNLKPNAKYELSNGTKFETNAHGYVEEISFTPDFSNPGKRDIRQTNLGKLGDEGDVGGHVQACVYGGTCDAYNLFPQNSNFNNSAYKVYFENIVRKAEKDGKTIGEATIRFSRNDPSSLRPDKVFVEFTIDGKKLDPVMFENKAGGGIK
ncbi:DNA/RNA non-specific endonuclease [Acinetobacter nematophilus]